MALRDWINIPVIKALSQHCSGTLFAIFTFWLVATGVKFGVHAEHTREIIDHIESYVLIVLWITLVVQMFIHLWKGGGNGSSHSILVA